MDKLYWARFAELVLYGTTMFWIGNWRGARVARKKAQQTINFWKGVRSWQSISRPEESGKGEETK
jgi:hypothetical protein